MGAQVSDVDSDPVPVPLRRRRLLVGAPIVLAMVLGLTVWRNQVLQLVIDHASPPQGTLTQAIPSPDGALLARVCEYDPGGATSDNSILIEVGPARGDGGSRRVYSAVAWEVSVSWEGSRTLTVNGTRLDVRRDTYVEFW
jgi:hypothetical protein